MADKTGYIGRNPNDSATAIARQFFTTSDVTTDFTFASGYNPGFLDVYVDGVKRRVADEFTATDGSTFTVLQGGVGAGSTVEAVAYKAFNAGSVSGDVTGNLNVSGNSALEGTLDVTGATTLSSLTVSGTTTLGAGTSVGFANTAFNIGGTPDITIASLSAVDINVSGAATIGGILTYEDVTNIDSVGIVTARTGVEVTANGLVINAGVSTFAADVSIADKIVHTGDTNTAIRFPSVDTFTVETAGVERVRVDSSGDVGLVGIATATGLVVVAGSGNYAGHAGVVTAVTFDGNVTGDVTGSISGGTVAGSTGTFTGDVDIADKIIHTGDTNTAIRFPSADTFTVETGGIQRFEVNSSGDIGVVGVATATGLVVVAGSGDYAGHAGVVTAVTFDGNVTGDVTGAASQVTVADESSDTTCFPLFVTGSTGNLEPKSGSNLTFNSSSGALTASSFVGALTGAATQVTVADESSDTSCNVLFTTAATGDLAPKSGTNLTFNSSSGALTATSFVGALTGNVTGDVSGSSGSCTGNSATATEATNSTITANNSTDETVYPVFVDGATGTQGLESDTGLSYNPSSNTLTTTTFAGALTGNAATASALQESRTIAGVAFDGTSNISLNNNSITNGAGYITATLTNEQVQDIVGGMVSGNTESGITVTYQDGDGTLDFSVASQTDNNFTNSDHSKLDGIESGATADQTASEILTLIKTVDGSGSGLDADTLDGVSSGSFLRADAADTCYEDITFIGGAGAVSIGGGSDIRLTNGDWTGDHLGKIQHHSNTLYIGMGSNGLTFRESGTDRCRIDGSGNLHPSANNTYTLGTSSNYWSTGYFVNMECSSTLNVRGAIDLADDDVLRFGSGDDAEFTCDGTDFFLDLNSGINDFKIRDGTTLRFTFDDAGHFTATGNVTAYSDITLKENIKTIPNALDKVLNLRGVEFDRIDNEEKPHEIGVIAQEVEKVIPEVVLTHEDGLKSVAYGNLVGLLIESIKELKAEIETLKEESN